MAPRPKPGITCECATDEKHLRRATFYHGDGIGPISVTVFLCERHAEDLANAGWEVARIDDQDTPSGEGCGDE